MNYQFTEYELPITRVWIINYLSMNYQLPEYELSITWVWNTSPLEREHTGWSCCRPIKCFAHLWPGREKLRRSNNWEGASWYTDVTLRTFFGLRWKLQKINNWEGVITDIQTPFANSNMSVALASKPEGIKRENWDTLPLPRYILEDIPSKPMNR